MATPPSERKIILCDSEGAPQLIVSLIVREGRPRVRVELAGRKGALETADERIGLAVATACYEFVDAIERIVQTIN
jgi:hypothetical protein